MLAVFAIAASYISKLPVKLVQYVYWCFPCDSFLSVPLLSIYNSYLYQFTFGYQDICPPI